MSKNTSNLLNRNKIRFAALLAATLGVAGHAAAFQYDWTGGGGTLNTGWNAPANWLNGWVPVSNSSSVVYFQNNGPGNFQNIANPLVVNQLNFGPGVSTTTGGNAVEFASPIAGGGLPVIAVQSNLANTINNNLSLIDTLSVTGPGIGTLTIAGVISGPESVNAYQPGVLRLSGNETFTGPLTIAGGGTVALAADNVLPLNGDVLVSANSALTLEGNAGNGSSAAPVKPLHSISLDHSVMRVPNSGADFWLNHLTLTGGSVDLSGSAAFWMHFTGPTTPLLQVNASDKTAVINGGSLCELRNDAANYVAINVGAGTTASGIDLDVTAALVSTGGAFDKFGGGTMRLTNTTVVSNANLVIDAGTVRFDTPMALPTGSIQISGGTLQYGGTGSVSTNVKTVVVAGTINVSDAQATANLASGVTGHGTLHKNGAGTLEVPNLSLFGLHLDQGTVRVTPNGAPSGTSNIDSLWASGTHLDLTNNDLIINGVGAHNFADTVALVKSGYANGSWAGPGISSSSAAAAAGHRALGIAKASDVFASFPATFSGQAVAPTDVLVKYTVTGDANLDGTVDLTDFTYLAGNFNGSGKTWIQGDFNYDGKIDLTDFTFLASNFNATLAAPGMPAAAMGAAVPEPTILTPAIALIAAASCSGGASRRRRARR